MPEIDTTNTHYDSVSSIIKCTALPPGVGLSLSLLEWAVA